MQAGNYVIVHTIGVGTGGGRASPIFYPRDFINIHVCSDHGVYYVRPPKNEIASYVYGAYKYIINHVQNLAIQLLQNIVPTS